MSEEIFKEENIFTQHDGENKQLKEENEKLRNEENEKLRNEENEKLRNEENEKLRKTNLAKDPFFFLKFFAFFFKNFIQNETLIQVIKLTQYIQIVI